MYEPIALVYAEDVDAGILGFEMYKQGQQFYAGYGIVEKGVEFTIKNIDRLGRYGMRETKEEIIKMMTNPASHKSNSKFN